MTSTIDDPRQNWLAQIETYNPIIANLEAGNLIYPIGRDAVAATAAWPSDLRRQRAAVQELLRLYPPASAR